MVLGSEAVVEGKPAIRPRIMEKEQWVALTSTQQMNFSTAHGDHVVGNGHIKTPIPCGDSHVGSTGEASQLICRRLGMTSVANSVMLRRVSSEGTLPTEKFATKMPKPTRRA